MTDNNLLTADNETPPEETNLSDARPEGVPEKFWDAETNAIRVEALLASYLALEKKLSKMVAIPENDDDKKRLHKILGCPDCADDYQVTLDTDILTVDPALNARLHAKGFTNEQVQEIYDVAVEKLVPMILDMATEFEADRELERLITAFGGPEKWAVIARQLQDFGQKNIPPVAYQGLCCSYEGVMALYQMMKNSTVQGFSGKDSGPIEGLDEQGLRRMMQNPKYWRERDPNFIARVSEGFERLYEGG